LDVAKVPYGDLLECIGEWVNEDSFIHKSKHDRIFAGVKFFCFLIITCSKF
jgi:hypothetical protein